MNKNQELRDIVTKRLISKFGDFEKEWQDMAKGLGVPLVEYFIQGFQRENNFIHELRPGAVSIVIDNNFIFGQIKGAILKGKKLEDTFIYKLTQLSFISIVAPFKLQEELFNKIESVLKNGKLKAIKYANTLLSKITIRDAQWTDEWKKANNLIGDRTSNGDVDDVPYLALAFDAKSHAIVSKDYVFNKQGEVQVWDIPKIDNVMTNYYKGSFSLILVGMSGHIIQAILKLLLLFFKLIFSFIFCIFKLILTVISKGIETITRISAPILLIGGAAIVLLYIKNENFKQLVDNLLKRGKENIANFIEKTLEQLSELFNFVKEMAIEYKSPFVTGFEVLGFLTLEYQELTKMMEELDRKKPC